MSDAKIMFGGPPAEKLKSETLTHVRAIKAATGKSPMLAAILVGDDPASQVYVNRKSDDCADCEIECRTYKLNADVSEEYLIDTIEMLNKSDGVDGILVQLPLPAHIDENAVKSAIDPLKDVDCFHPANAGRLWTGNHGHLPAGPLLPCTPAGVMYLLNYYGVSVRGRNVCVVGRSNLVGKPLADMLLHEDATVTVCHSKTRDLRRHVQSADVVITAIGRPDVVTRDMVGPDTVLIDVGTNIGPDGKLRGDCDAGTHEACRAYTPVPKGVGLMTRAWLMRNVAVAAENRHKINTGFGL